MLLTHSICNGGVAGTPMKLRVCFSVVKWKVAILLSSAYCRDYPVLLIGRHSSLYCDSDVSTHV